MNKICYTKALTDGKRFKGLSTSSQMHDHNEALSGKILHEK